MFGSRKPFEERENEHGRCDPSYPDNQDLHNGLDKEIEEKTCSD
jgi:hypothetical protein